MYKKIAKKCLLLWILFILIIAGTIAPVQNNKFIANAGTCDNCFVAYEYGSPWLSAIANFFTAMPDTLLSLVPRLLVMFAKFILTLLSKILQWIMVPVKGTYFYDLNRYIPTPENPSTVVSWIWQVSLYYANVMITLILIWIAINIILERKGYTSYHSLINILVIALLVNFSLVICTALVDFSNYIAALFLSGSSFMNDFSCMYTCVVHKVANIFNCMGNKLIMSMTISNSLALMVGIIFIGQVLGLIFFVLTRMITLWFLVGVSPIAFVCYAVPETRKFFDLWWNHFKANLIKLPAIAFVTYFILNIMIYIANSLMLKPTEGLQWGNDGENIWAWTLSVVFLMIGLSQAILMAAQSLNVSEVTKWTEKVSTAAMSGWNMIKNPLIRRGKEKIWTSKPVQALTNRIKNSRFYPLAKKANKLMEKFRQEQKNTQKTLSQFKDNGNYGVLARIAKLNANPKNPMKSDTEFVQAMQLIAKGVEDRDFSDDQNILTDKQNMIRLKRLMNNDLYSETEAGKYLKNRFTWIKEGSNVDKFTVTEKTYYEGQARAAFPAAATPTKKQINDQIDEIIYSRPYRKVGTHQIDIDMHKKLMRGLNERASDREKAKANNWMFDFKRFYDEAINGNNPSDFMEIFKSILTTFGNKQIKNIFASIPTKQKGDFWNMLARMAIVADMQRRGLFPAGTSIANAFANVTPAQIEGTGRNSAVQAIKDLTAAWIAGGGDGWMARGDKGLYNTLFNNQFIK